MQARTQLRAREGSVKTITPTEAEEQRAREVADSMGISLADTTVEYRLYLAGVIRDPRD